MSDQPASTRRSSSATVLLFVGALLASLVCFIGAAAELSALGREHQAPTAVLVTACIAFAAGSIVLLRVAIHAEHRARLLSPRPAVTPQPVAVRRPVKNSPIARLIGIVFLAGFVVLLVVITLSMHRDAARSSETQHHGVVRSATIDAVHSEAHATRYDSWTTYDYDVTLAVPVDGRTTTDLHDPSKDFQRFDTGETTSVLVDPKDPGYAELQGHAVQTLTWIAMPITVAACFLVVAIAVGFEERKHRRAAAHPAEGGIVQT